MHAASHILTETSINEGGFTPIPGWLVAFVASLIALYVALHISGRYRREDVHTTRDTLIDVVVLLSAGSVVASLSTTPLLASLTTSFYRNLQVWLNSKMHLGTSIMVGGGIILILIVLLLGLLYIKNTSGWWLFWFGLGLQIAAVFAPWINTALSWWVNNPVMWLWNFLIWLITVIPSVQIQF